MNIQKNLLSNFYVHNSRFLGPRNLKGKIRAAEYLQLHENNNLKDYQVYE
jgi:hypothetical protein